MAAQIHQICQLGEIRNYEREWRGKSILFLHGKLVFDSRYPENTMIHVGTPKAYSGGTYSCLSAQSVPIRAHIHAGNKACPWGTYSCQERPKRAHGAYVFAGEMWN